MPKCKRTKKVIELSIIWERKGEIERERKRESKTKIKVIVSKPNVQKNSSYRATFLYATVIMSKSLIKESFIYMYINEIMCYKKRYRAKLANYIYKNIVEKLFCSSTTANQISGKISIFQGTQFVPNGWRKVSCTTRTNCFAHHRFFTSWVGQRPESISELNKYFIPVENGYEIDNTYENDAFTLMTIKMYVNS